MKTIKLTGIDAVRITESNKDAIGTYVIDCADAVTKNKAHRDAFQVIPSRNDGMYNTQFAGAIISKIQVVNNRVDSDGKLQCLFCSDGGIDKAWITDNVFNTAGAHHISLCLLSGHIQNNRDSGGVLVPIKLFPLRIGGNPDGKFNVFILSFLNPAYQYRPINEIVKDATFDHVTDHRFGYERRKDGVYLVNFDLDGFVAATQEQQLTAGQMRDLALVYGERDDNMKNRPETNLLEIQRQLAMLTLYTGNLDGLDGPKTRNALDEFMEREGPDGDISRKLLDKVQSIPLGSYSDGAGLASAVKILCECIYITDKRIHAYMMATAEHETGGAFLPVFEAYHVRDNWAREAYLKKLWYYPYFGVGLVQISLMANYIKYASILGVESRPLNDQDYEWAAKMREIFSNPAISLFILVHGMATGAFTGRSVHRYINANGADTINARRVVNGVRKGEKLPDRAVDIENLYKKWLGYYEHN